MQKTTGAGASCVAGLVLAFSVWHASSLQECFNHAIQIRKQRLREADDLPNQEYPGAWTQIQIHDVLGTKVHITVAPGWMRECGGRDNENMRRRDQEAERALVRLAKNPGEIGEDLKPGEPSWNGQGRVAVTGVVEASW